MYSIWLRTEIQKFVSTCIWTSDILFILHLQNPYVQYKNLVQTFYWHPLKRACHWQWKLCTVMAKCILTWSSEMNTAITFRKWMCHWNSFKIKLEFRSTIFLFCGRKTRKPEEKLSEIVRDLTANSNYSLFSTDQFFEVHVETNNKSAWHFQQT